MLIGLVGKPSAGKSTFFQALTSVSVARAAYPFTTIEPNKGKGFVEVECADKDLGVQCNPRLGFCEKGRRFVPVDLLDVAGLVPGAHEGKGLGNKFLDDLRNADVLIHVVDASGSTDANGNNVNALSHNPAEDVRFLEEELNFWIDGILKKGWTKIARESRSKKTTDVVHEQLTGLGFSHDHVRKAIGECKLDAIPAHEWNDAQRFDFVKAVRAVGKPIIIAANKCDVKGALENAKRLQAEFPTYLVIACSAEAEMALKAAAKAGFVHYVPGDADFTITKALNPAQTNALETIRASMKEMGGTGVQKCLNAAVFDFLKYIAIFPGGVNNLTDSQGRVLPDCFLLPPGSRAIDFAGAIHSTMADKFVKAINVKTKRVMGADHPLAHRDVVEIAFSK